MKTSVITANNISIGYHKSTYGHDSELYTNLSFELYAGELTCLLGQNGAGKSTLLRTISGIQPLLNGDLYLDNKKLNEYSESELSYKLGLVLTDKTSVGGFTVWQLAALGRYPYTGFWGRLSKTDKDVVQKAIEDVGISHKSNSYIAELSDGERQKVMIAKALAQECPIILLDEPTAFLDVPSRIEIMDLLHKLASEHGKSILLSTHDVELSLLLADRLWLLSRENGLKCGVTEDILLNGDMESFLSRDNIVFDINSGNFYPQKTFNRFVFLEAEKEYYHWTVNFLQRNLWDTTKDKSNADFILRMESPQKIQITKNTQNTEFESFEKFQEWLSIQ